jgi:hypothetical protein
MSFNNNCHVYIKRPLWKHLSFQFNFDIPIFEGQIDADALEKWLNILEGYLSVHNFFDRENITFALLKALPHVKHWWESY